MNGNSFEMRSRMLGTSGKVARILADSKLATRNAELESKVAKLEAELEQWRATVQAQAAALREVR
jgi:outer membrane murein-binding lipoprotein Lpp